MRKTFSLLLTIIFVLTSGLQASAQNKLPETDSPSIILIDSKSGQILYEKDIHKRLYPASITKVLTALITLEKCKLNEKVTASKKAIYSIEPKSSTASFQPGEILTVEQLLYALMLNSANEAANILAEHISGSIEGFADMMNSKAKEFGALDSHFVNPNGLHNDNHYTTVYDMSLIAKQALAIPEFRKIVSATRYKMPDTNKYSKGDKVFFNSNKLINKSNKNYYKYATGVKTGYTLKAGHSLIASACKGDMELVTVIMNSEKVNGVLQAYTDSTELFDYVFANYKIIEPVKSGKLIKQVAVQNTDKNTKLDVTAENDISFIFPKNNTEYTYFINEKIDENLKAPIKKGTVVGSLEYLIKGKVIGSTSLVAGNSIAPAKLFGSENLKSFFLKLLILLRNICIIFVILFVSLIIWAKIRYRLKHKNRYKAKSKNTQASKNHLLKIEELLQDK